MRVRRVPNPPSSVASGERMTTKKSGSITLSLSSLSLDTAGVAGGERSFRDVHAAGVGHVREAG